MDKQEYVPGIKHEGAGIKSKSIQKIRRRKYRYVLERM
jgi:hypothetical protein